jgi:hypothetical protein
LYLTGARLQVLWRHLFSRLSAIKELPKLNEMFNVPKSDREFVGRLYKKYRLNLAWNPTENELSQFN